MNNLFYCFWAHDTKYRDMAEFCAASFMRYSVPVNVMRMETRGGWMKNCLARVPLLKKLADCYPDNTITLLDADLTCVSDPGDMKKFNAGMGDVLAHDKGTGTSPNIRYCAGVISFAPTEKARDCLADWARRCEEDADPKASLREQLYLFQAIEEWRAKGLSVVKLQDQYNLVDSPAVIMHHVASRKMMEIVGGKQ